MGWDIFILIFAFGGLLFAFFSLLIGKMFIQKRNGVHALDTLWYIAVALLFSFSLVAVEFHRRTQKLEEGIEDLQAQIEKLRDKYDTAADQN
jgi:hypothetical protein